MTKNQNKLKRNGEAVKNEKNTNVFERMLLNAYRDGISLLCAISGMRPTERSRQLQSGDNWSSDYQPGPNARFDRPVWICIGFERSGTPRWLVCSEGKCEQYVGYK